MRKIGSKDESETINNEELFKYSGGQQYENPPVLSPLNSQPKSTQKLKIGANSENQPTYIMPVEKLGTYSSNN